MGEYYRKEGIATKMRVNKNGGSWETMGDNENLGKIFKNVINTICK